MGSSSISPLATSQHKASPTVGDTAQPVADDEENPFEYGLGTQVMLSSMQTPAMELLVDQARRLLNEEEVEELVEVLDNVSTTHHDVLAAHLLHSIPLITYAIMCSMRGLEM